MFSVIMPVYNHEQYVHEAIGSVVAQTFEDWELWAVDDGSTDEAGQILDRWAERERRIHVLHQANAGPAVARNVGFRRSRGPWLAFLDSDDVFFPDTLAAYREFIQSHPDVRFLYGYRHRLNDDGTTTELPGEFQDAPTGAAELFVRMHLSHLCVCYRRELLEAVGGYDERLRSVEDYDLYLRLSAKTDFHPLGKATGLRRRHDTNLSEQSGYSRMVQAAVLRRYVEHFGGRDVLGADLIARRLGQIHYAAGRQYFKQRCFAQSLAALQTSISQEPTIKARGLRLLGRLLRPFGTRDDREPPQL